MSNKVVKVHVGLVAGMDADEPTMHKEHVDVIAAGWNGEVVFGGHGAPDELIVEIVLDDLELFIEKMWDSGIKAVEVHIK